MRDAGVEGKCPTCERPLADELPTVLANFDSQIRELSEQIASLDKEKREAEAGAGKIDQEQANRTDIAARVEQLRTEKSKADAQVIEHTAACQELERRTAESQSCAMRSLSFPTGFDQARFRELHRSRGRASAQTRESD